MLNAISSNPEFRKTRLFEDLKKTPLGFVDVGALGGIHPLVEPLASHTHALCFEPDPADCAALREKYKSQCPFSKITVVETALGTPGRENEQLYISKVPTNTSLLKPSEHFIRRYHAKKFEVDRVVPIKTRTLDKVLAETAGLGPRMGELLKLDTQGSECRILKGATRMLSEACLGIWCEVEFFQVYEGQETFADVDLFLREYGFLIYGLYPHYRSVKSLDRSLYRTEERLMWADAVFIKDPLDPRNFQRTFSDRDMNVLILIAMMTRFYDFALELIRRTFEEGAARTALESVVRELARINPEDMQREIKRLYDDSMKAPEGAWMLAEQFVTRHRSNNTVEHLFDRAR